MKIKVSEASGAVLDWMVAECEGYETFTDRIGLQTMFTDKGWKPSTNWAQGGPIIEREEIDLTKLCPGTWRATSANHWFNGPTPLIAAMRCYVASELGDEVDVPEELT